MVDEVDFRSDGVVLKGLFSRKERAEAVAGLVLAHGFAGAQYPKLRDALTETGYAVLDFNFRSYGKSGGERGRVVPAEQVADISAAVTWLAERSEVDPERIAVVGSSLGGSVAIIAAARDKRIKACVAGCPLANGDAILRKQYPTQAQFDDFMGKVEAAKRDGTRIHRYEIVHIPEHLRGALPPGTPMEFTADTIYGFLDMNPAEYVAQLAPAPLLLVHAVDDEVVPIEESRRLAKLAGGNCELVELGSGNHFIFGMQPCIERIAAWLQRRFPATPAAARA
jgi:dipeptidyl aminopeptidase/acylaminoacyl peptidase